MHLLDSDEMFHFYLGDPVEMLQLYPDGGSAVFTLGQFRGGRTCAVAGSRRSVAGYAADRDGKMALLGCTVVPGFNYADYHNASFAELAAKWPEQAERIRALTRS